MNKSWTCWLDMEKRQSIPVLEALTNHNLNKILTNSLTAASLPGLLVDHNPDLITHLPGFPPLKVRPFWTVIVWRYVCLSSWFVSSWRVWSELKWWLLCPKSQAAQSRPLANINRFLRQCMNVDRRGDCPGGNGALPCLLWPTSLGKVPGLVLNFALMGCLSYYFLSPTPQIAGSNWQHLTLRSKSPIWPNCIFIARVSSTVVYICWFVHELKRMLLRK